MLEMLTDVQRQFWDAYIAAESRAPRAEKLQSLDAFLDALTASPPTVWFPWARSIAEQVVDHGGDLVIRRPLFERAVFPDRMLVTYGIDDGTGNQTVSRYVSADGVTSWDSVVAARIQLLSATVKNGVTLSTQSASFAGGTFTPSPPDKRLRTQVTEVVTLRNRAP